MGLALGSGGIRGLAHIGVIKTLLKYKIPIDYIAGASIGAWVGAHYALFQDIHMLEALTVGSKKEKLATFLDPSLRGGLIGGAKMKKLLGQWLQDGVFEQTSIPFAAVATDINKRETCVFSTGKIVPAVQASMAIPGVFKPILYQDRVLIDGAVSNPIPSDVVRAMGADIVIGVNLYRVPEDATRVTTDIGLVDVTKRSMEILRYYLAKHSTVSADVVIEPAVEAYAGWSRYFTRDVGQEIVMIGEREAEKAISDIQRLSRGGNGISLKSNRIFDPLS